MRKLTIGSLKYDSMKSTVSINLDPPILKERPVVDETSRINEKTIINETNRIVEVEQNRRYFQIELQKGRSLLDAALEQKAALNYSCQKGTCGKCKVKVMNGSAYLQPPNSLEEKKLQGLLQNGFRLACQAAAR